MVVAAAVRAPALPMEGGTGISGCPPPGITRPETSCQILRKGARRINRFESTQDGTVPDQ